MSNTDRDSESLARPVERGVMLPLAWSNEPPTAPGYYWKRRRRTPRGEPQICTVWEEDGDLMVGIWVKTDFAVGSVQDREWEWAGPIPEPIEQAA